MTLKAIGLHYYPCGIVAQAPRTREPEHKAVSDVSVIVNVIDKHPDARVREVIGNTRQSGVMLMLFTTTGIAQIAVLSALTEPLTLDGREKSPQVSILK